LAHGGHGRGHGEELGVHVLDAFRAALELAISVFRQHPEFFDFVNGKAKKEW